MREAGRPILTPARHPDRFGIPPDVPRFTRQNSNGRYRQAQLDCLTGRYEICLRKASTGNGREALREYFADVVQLTSIFARETARRVGTGLATGVARPVNHAEIGVLCSAVFVV
jgi:hypothetical protein